MAQAKKNSTNRPVTFDHLKSMKKAIHKNVWICMDSEVAERHALSEEELRRVERRANTRPEDAAAQDELAEAKKAHDKITEELRDQSVQFKFKSLGRKKYEQLLMDHPISDEDIKRAERAGQDPSSLSWGQSFAPALVAACLVEPELTFEQVNEIFEDSDEWNGAETLLLFSTALEVNQTRAVPNLGKG